MLPFFAIIIMFGMRLLWVTAWCLNRKVNVCSGEQSLCRRSDATGHKSVTKRGFYYSNGGKFFLSVMTDFAPFFLLKPRVKISIIELDLLGYILMGGQGLWVHLPSPHYWTFHSKMHWETFVLSHVWRAHPLTVSEPERAVAAGREKCTSAV